MQIRAQVTGRVVPQELLERTMEEVPKSVARLEPLVDFFVEISNSDEGDVTLVTDNMTWKTFKSRWAQTCLPKKTGSD